MPGPRAERLPLTGVTGEHPPQWCSQVTVPLGEPLAQGLRHLFRPSASALEVPT